MDGQALQDLVGRVIHASPVALDRIDKAMAEP
jgi:hypothetical protein